MFMVVVLGNKAWFLEVVSCEHCTATYLYVLPFYKNK